MREKELFAEELHRKYVSQNEAKYQEDIMRRSMNETF